MQKLPISLDHFVGEREYFVRDRETKRLGGLEIYDQFKLGGLNHRHLGRLLAPQDSACIVAGLAPCIRWVSSIADQTAEHGEYAVEVHGGQRIACG